MLVSAHAASNWASKSAAAYRGAAEFPCLQSFVVGREQVRQPRYDAALDHALNRRIRRSEDLAKCGGRRELAKGLLGEDALDGVVGGLLHSSS